MKKLIFAGVVALVVVLTMGALAGYAFAQTPVPNTPFGPGGMMGGRGMRGGAQGGGMMGGYAGGMMGRGQTGLEGPMHEYMVAAMADALNMNAADLEAAIDSGKTMWDVAQEKGLTQDEFFTAMQAARTEALKQAVAAGVITQEQADWMLQRNMGGFGGGRGGGRGGQSGCPMNGGGWNTQPTTPNSNTNG